MLGEEDKKEKGSERFPLSLLGSTETTLRVAWRSLFLFQPIECRTLIDKLRGCSPAELLAEFSSITAWTYGKCELYHWIDILDICDGILEEASSPAGENTWTLKCDLEENGEVSRRFDPWYRLFFLISQFFKISCDENLFNLEPSRAFSSFIVPIQ